MAATTRLQLPGIDRLTFGGGIRRFAKDLFQIADDRLMQSGAGSPAGSVTSHWVGQPYRDTTTNEMWHSIETGTTWWRRFRPEPVSHEGDALYYEGDAVTEQGIN
ncbi:hypothetical protein LCGC14_0825770 [marine sediment metagenome]|uniref:Uncharacterized protein n=1 Tax=marine sediment metagenome TaxID=412755 RepID=A0A0F9S2B6_9ZZZZ